MPSRRFGDLSPHVLGHQLYNTFLKKRILSTEPSAHEPRPTSLTPQKPKNHLEECRGCHTFKNEDLWSWLFCTLSVFQISPHTRCLGWAWGNPRPGAPSSSWTPTCLPSDTKPVSANLFGHPTPALTEMRKLFLHLRFKQHKLKDAGRTRARCRSLWPWTPRSAAV